MTTIAEFKRMLQEEIDEPLDYPRVPGLTAEGLRGYNEGYQSACQIVLMEAGATEDDWRKINIECLTKWIPEYKPTGYPWTRGRVAAYTWALAELKALEPESETPTLTASREDLVIDIQSSDGGRTRRWTALTEGTLPPVVREWAEGKPTPAAVLAEALEPTYQWVLMGSDGKPVDGMVCVPRARYNYLLDLERSVSEFTESFTRWEA